MDITVGPWIVSDSFNPTGERGTAQWPDRLSLERSSSSVPCVGVGGNVLLPLLGAYFGISGYTAAKVLYRMPQELTRHHMFSDEQLEAALSRLMDVDDKLYELVPEHNKLLRRVVVRWAAGLLEGAKWREFLAGVDTFLDDKQSTPVQVCECPHEFDVVILANAPVGFRRIRPALRYLRDMTPLVVNMQYLERIASLLCGTSDTGYPIPDFVWHDQRSVALIGQSFAAALVLQLVGSDMLIAKVDGQT